LKNLELLIEKTTAANHKKNQQYHKDKLISDYDMLDNRTVYMILEHINYSINIRKRLNKVNIDIKCRTISDLSTLVVLETIFFYLVKSLKIEIKYNFINHVKLIEAEPIYRNTLLKKYNNVLLSDTDFLDIFESKNTDLNSYRVFCENDRENLETDLMSKYTTDIYLTTKNFSNKHIASEIQELCGEIINNTLEHSDGDSIISIVFEKFENKFFYIYLSSVSITNILLGQKICELIGRNDFGIINNGDVVKKAYSNQKAYFSEKYGIEDFSMISAFQQYVSTRKDSLGSGGTGLTTLLKKLQGRIVSEKATYCYAHSGSKTLFFYPKFLNINDDGSIGFNNKNDFINEPPSHETYQKLQKYFPGTIFNIAFIFEI